MRVLTKYEHKAFEQAFDFIDRVCAIGFKVDNLFDIKTMHESRTDTLPGKVAIFISELGGAKSASKFFNGHSKEKTLPRFIKKLMDNYEQPRDYFAQGILILDIIPVSVTEYQE